MDKKKYLEELAKNFSTFYDDDYDIIGDNINKVQIHPRVILHEYINFYKWCRIIQILVSFGFIDIKKLRFLDTGMGNGQDIRKLIELGAKPENCYGVDFAEKAFEYAKKHSPPETNLMLCQFDEMNFPDKYFDVIFL